MTVLETLFQELSCKARSLVKYYMEPWVRNATLRQACKYYFGLVLHVVQQVPSKTSMMQQS